MRRTIRVSALLLILAAAAAPAAAQAPAVREGKPGGILRPVLREDLPQGFAIHESATNSVTWPAMPCYGNLVIYDQTKRLARRATMGRDRRPALTRLPRGARSSIQGP